MNILFLGGTSFVGRHIAEAAIAAGNAVTFFNRGITDGSLFADQRRLRGDRSQDVSILGAVDAEVVIDTSGYTPNEVRASALAVAPNVPTYVFMSSIDAYDLSLPSVDESSPTKVLPEGASLLQRLPGLYGPHKVLCEQILVDILGAERVLSVRAGLMAGPHDNTDRFTYWPVRVGRGGEILAPPSREMPVQVIDVRDVAAWILTAIESKLRGVFNAVGTPGALTFGSVVDACRQVSRADASFCYASSEFLKAQGVEPWVEMPLWVPDIAELSGLRNVCNDLARARGLRLRPLAATVEDVLTEYHSRSSQLLRAGLTAEREAILLERWHAER